MCLYVLMSLAHFPENVWLPAKSSHVSSVNYQQSCECCAGWGSVCVRDTVFVHHALSFSYLLLWPSGADLSALVREAAIAALKERMQVRPVGQRQAGGERGRGKETAMQDGSLQTEDQLFEDCCVAAHHFETAFGKVKASVSGRVGGQVNGN